MPTFSDVPEDHIFYDDIEAIYAAGITAGYDDGTYRPWEEVTRGQMAAYLRRALDLEPPQPPDPEPPPSGIWDAEVNPGDDVQAVLMNAGNGAVIGFNPGIYRVTIEPLPGQILMSTEPDHRAILDGLQELRQAIVGDAPNVKILDLEVTGYVAGSQQAVIGGPQNALHFKPGGWEIDGCYVHDNGGVGILLRGNGATITNTRIIRQDQLGFGVGFGYDGLVEDVEVAYANHNDRYNWEFEGGGCKNWESDRLTLRRIYSHDNHGPGLWCDNANVKTLYENNRIEDNQGPGIFHEISHGATIRSNILRRNGYPAPTDVNHPYKPHGGFLLAQAGEVFLEDNLVEQDVHGVVALNQCRTWSSHIGVTSGNTLVYARRNVLRDIVGYLAGPITDCGEMPIWDWDDSNTIEYSDT